LVFVVDVEGGFDHAAQLGFVFVARAGELGDELGLAGVAELAVEEVGLLFLFFLAGLALLVELLAQGFDFLGHVG
jgi:hypothetical protein